MEEREEALAIGRRDAISAPKQPRRNSQCPHPLPPLPHDAFVSPLRQSFDGDADAAADSLSRLRRLPRERSRSRRRKHTWKKLMWVKQSYPDNYTDQATFLENLQRNPRLKPYDFWPLVADSTVILQHVCSVILFIVCFVGIFQERLSPVSLVGGSSLGTFLGWILWERWVSEEEDQEDEVAPGGAAPSVNKNGSLRRRNRAASIRRPLPLLRTDSVPSNTPSAAPSRRPSPNSSTTNLQLQIPVTVYGSERTQPTTPVTPTTPTSPLENRLHQRLGTIKSALLICSTLLGLSPILKSLTRSTSSDSIWAMSFWLLTVNIFFFDYSGGVGAKFPASLSTNAALMASTVLASRLPSTKQVFSLTLFSIEVFGLFPVFRRHIRHRSFKYHALMTVLLVLGAGWGVGMVIGEPRVEGWPWKRGIGGMVVAVILATIATGGCSWWLIGLQKYKNEIRGPWDPARPIIMSRPRWE
ncbi:Phosphatidylinositol N-acetylglucosaminyltransferase GPI2 subunit [Cladobotryum mycophilum]|uniref:Phosphatidylinositol N-acetylglucosaminyltransferase GPI2 subunit n=1 Tax=Cladobotryum mycophilum TaxID=491253 RepID=A0ABR0SFU3_9HYPO